MFKRSMTVPEIFGLALHLIPLQFNSHIRFYIYTKSYNILPIFFIFVVFLYQYPKHQIYTHTHTHESYLSQRKNVQKTDTKLINIK